MSSEGGGPQVVIVVFPKMTHSLLALAVDVDSLSQSSPFLLGVCGKPKFGSDSDINKKDG